MILAWLIVALKVMLDQTGGGEKEEDRMNYKWSKQTNKAIWTKPEMKWMESLRWSEAEPHRCWRTGLSHPYQKHRQHKSCSRWEMSRRSRTTSHENFDVWGIYCVQCWFAAFILAVLHWPPGGTWGSTRNTGESWRGCMRTTDEQQNSEQLFWMGNVRSAAGACQNHFLQAPHAHVLAHTGNNRLHLGDGSARLPRCSPFVLAVCCVSPFFEDRSSIVLCCLHDHFNWTFNLTTGRKPQRLWWAVQRLSPFLLLGFMFFTATDQKHAPEVGETL